MAVTDARSAPRLSGARLLGLRVTVTPGSASTLLPAAVGAAVVIGMAIVVLATPVGSGDYGQWLMTSRYYMGQSVPDYRVISDVPVVVPALLAMIRVVVPDPMMALHVLAAFLTLGLGAAFYLCGTVVLGSRWLGVATVAAGYLVTDRFSELFAFGGLLQIAALTLLILSVSFFARAGRNGLGARRWWALAIASLAFAALAHVGTGLIAVPIGMSLGLMMLAASRASWWHAPKRVIPVAAGLAAVGLYWATALWAASAEYVSNPASLGYRGPERLFELLIGPWPTTLIVVVGGIAIALGALRSLLLRRADGFAVLAVWSVFSWGLLAYSIVIGSATDYPRFATPLLAPLVVGTAAGSVWVLRTLADYLHRQLSVPVSVEGVVAAGMVLAILVAGPLAIDRQSRQADFYQLRDQESLQAASAWLDERLGSGAATVLAEAREAKWIEGLTGRAALFSQPVRYAFRPIEWERSVAADALLRSSTTLTSGLIAARLTGLVGGPRTAAPSDLLLAVNHRGEFLDLLRIPASSIHLRASGEKTSAATLLPAGTSWTVGTETATVRSQWQSVGDGPGFVQRLTTWQNGSAMAVVQRSPGRRLTTSLLPAAGMSITSLTITGHDAVACFTQVGDSQPCVRIHVSQPDSRIRATSDGGVRVATRRSDRLDLLVTALTAGEASVRLSLLQPAQVADEYHIGAALLYEPDPAYAERARRLAAIGFTEVRAFGPYRVLLRERSDTP